MSALSIEQDVGYRAALNPAFVRRSRENAQRRKVEEEQRKLIKKEQEQARKVQLTADEIGRKHKATLATIARSRSDDKFSEMMEELRRRNLEKGPKVCDIIDAVASKHGVSRAEILSQRRNRKIVSARHEAMAEAHVRRPDMSLPQLGRQFGGRDHTTIYHALKKMGVYRLSEGE